MNKDDKKEVMVKTQNHLTELKNTQHLCDMLMKTPHYAKMGAEGIFAIVETAKSLNIDPRQALGGGLYFVKGKVEMSSRMMASLIRSKKHSITRDTKSNNEICILHGKRADTKDCWSESFSIAEAKAAGIYKGPWQTYPRDMLYARALSRLARQLFPDIIGNCYVEGEISGDDSIQENIHTDNASVETPVEVVQNTISKEEVKELLEVFNKVPEYRKKIEEFLQKKDINSFEEMPKETYEKVLAIAKEKAKEADIAMEPLEELGVANV